MTKKVYLILTKKRSFYNLKTIGLKTTQQFSQPHMIGR